jgi:hypothetical protein
MVFLSNMRTALPPALDAHLKTQGRMEGGAPIKLQQLNSTPPSLGPIVFSGENFNTTVYTGPSMHFKSTPALGGHVNTIA